MIEILTAAQVDKARRTLAKQHPLWRQVRAFYHPASLLTSLPGRPVFRRPLASRAVRAR